MRIALVVPSLHGGGAEFVAAQWAAYLRDVGDLVTVLATRPNPGEDCVRIRGRWFGSRLLTLRRELHRGSYDVVLALAPHWNLLALLATRRLRNGPAVFISGRTLETESRRMGKNKGTEMALAKLFYRLADGYIAISHPTAAEAHAMFGVAAERVWVVPNPAIAKVPSNDTATPRCREITNRSPLEIVVPGRLVPGKRPMLAYEIARECARLSGRTVRLHYFGTGPEEPLLRGLSGAEVEIVLHGWVEHWFLQAPASGVVLLPSRIEGFANVLVEAAAANLPSVASSRALGVADAVVPGMTGVLTLSDRASDYAKALLEAETLNPASVAGTWIQRFSLESSGAKLRQSFMDTRDFPDDEMK